MADQDKFPTIKNIARFLFNPKARSDAAKVSIGGFNITLEKQRLTEINGDNVYTFGYRARKPGTTGRTGNLPVNAYDATPLILPLSYGRKYIVGLNVHYLTLLPDKTGFIFRWRKGVQFNSGMVKQMIHKYRMDRISSPLYLCKDLFVDARILSSKPTWTAI